MRTKFKMHHYINHLMTTTHLLQMKEKKKVDYHENIFLVFVSFSQKITKGIGFQIALNASDLQIFFYTTIASDITETNNKLFLTVLSFIPVAETPRTLNYSFNNRFTLSLISWTSDRKVVNAGLKYQVDIGRAPLLVSRKYIITAHQTEFRVWFLNKKINIAILDYIDGRNHFWWYWW